MLLRDIEWEQSALHVYARWITGAIRMNQLRQLFTTLGVATAHPASFLVGAAFVLLWFIFERDTLDLHGVATIATFFMTLLIQRAEHRDTQAIHAKLDELLAVESAARNSLQKIDQEEPEEIERQRRRDQSP